jgi:hypothetical protein
MMHETSVECKRITKLSRIRYTTRQISSLLSVMGTNSSWHSRVPNRVQFRSKTDECALPVRLALLCDPAHRMRAIRQAPTAREGEALRERSGGRCRQILECRWWHAPTTSSAPCTAPRGAAPRSCSSGYSAGAAFQLAAIAFSFESVTTAPPTVMRMKGL